MAFFLGLIALASFIAAAGCALGLGGAIGTGQHQTVFFLGLGFSLLTGTVAAGMAASVMRLTEIARSLKYLDGTQPASASYAAWQDRKARNGGGEYRVSATDHGGGLEHLAPAAAAPQTPPAPPSPRSQSLTPTVHADGRVTVRDGDIDQPFPTVAAAQRWIAMQ